MKSSTEIKEKGGKKEKPGSKLPEPEEEVWAKMKEGSY